MCLPGLPLRHLYDPTELRASVLILLRLVYFIFILFFPFNIRLSPFFWAELFFCFCFKQIVLLLLFLFLVFLFFFFLLLPFYYVIFISYPHLVFFCWLKSTNRNNKKKIVFIWLHFMYLVQSGYRILLSLSKRNKYVYMATTGQFLFNFFFRFFFINKNTTVKVECDVNKFSHKSMFISIYFTFTLCLRKFFLLAYFYSQRYGKFGFKKLNRFVIFD